jgi:translation initiation factor 2 beta subunit (eIF-2beta)/eIF-5
MKYLQKQLGCKTKGDLIFSKKITASDVDNVLEMLIEKIICEVCNNPEIVFSNEGKKKKFKIIKTCQACGGMTEIYKDEELKKILTLQV